MSRAGPADADQLPVQRPGRSPALPPAVAFALGILADHHRPLPLSIWLATALIAILAGFVLRLVGRRAASIGLLAALFGLGAARQHTFWSAAAPDDIRLCAGEAPALVRLRGTAASSPSIRRATQGPLQSSWAQVDRTVCTLECRAIETSDGWRIVSGQVRVNIDGQLPLLEYGDEVQVTGWLSRPMPPGNPGEFDFRDYLSRQGIGCTLSADHPDSLRRIADGRASFGRVFARLRSRGEALFERRLGPESAALANALLLGERGGLTSDVRDAFARSGMMHILAISGLNVAILAALVWPFCRLLRTTGRTTALVISGIVIAYACIADGAPPVTRATVLVVIAAAGLAWHRRVSMANALALAALVILVWRPSDLFDVGAQLSFLSVAGMVWIGGVRSRLATIRAEGELPSPERGPIGTALAIAGRSLRDSYLLIGAVWLFSLPLVMHQFHLVSPVGLLANVLLIPVVFVTLWMGYLMLAVGLIWSPAAAIFAPGVNVGLSVLSTVVDWAASVRFGHFTVPGPPTAWVIGYYALLAALLPAARDVRWLRRAGYPLAAWCVLGLALWLRPAPGDGLRCTFLSVGHGCSVLIETPSGRTLLYDAGSIQDATRARRAVEAAMQSRGRLRLDAIVISHADIDHFNGVPGLLESVPAGRIFAAPSFLDFKQPSVVECCEAAYRSRVPIRLLDVDDRLQIDPEVAVKVLHPPRGEDVSRVDNANSVVLLIEYAGRRILLTGDLEKDGLSRLLSLPPVDVDVMLSPHHGSVPANPPSLGTWARPEHVVASAGRRLNLADLQRNYGPSASVMSTGEHGAVTFTIAADGTLSVERQRNTATP